MARAAALATIPPSLWLYVQVGVFEVAMIPAICGLCLWNGSGSLWKTFQRASGSHVSLDSFGIELVTPGESTRVLWDELKAVRRREDAIVLEVEDGPEVVIPQEFESMDELHALLLEREP